MWMSSLLKKRMKLPFPSLKHWNDVFLSGIVLSSLSSERRLHNTKKAATEFTSCTSIISVVSICPSLNASALVFLKSTCCKSASNSPSGKTSFAPVYYQNYKESEIIWPKLLTQFPAPSSMSPHILVRRYSCSNIFNSCKQSVMIQ